MYPLVVMYGGARANIKRAVLPEIQFSAIEAPARAADCLFAVNDVLRGVLPGEHAKNHCSVR